LGATGEWTRAVDHYRAAAAAMPGHYPTLFNLGRALQKAGQDEAAVAEYQNAVNADSAQPEAWLALGMVCERTDRAADARAAYERYLQLAPDSPERAKVEKRLAATPPNAKS
jgi:Flp pilus assembly protein TadD